MEEPTFDDRIDELARTRGDLRAVEVLRFFDYTHLPPKLKAISQPVGELAIWMVDHHHLNKGDGEELAEGLRKLLEAKDCFVRAAL